MSISITGGISFSGGVGITAAPPSVATAGWWGAGQATSSVQRVTFATDTATATLRGSLMASGYKYGLAAAGTLTDGWYGGGTGPGAGPSGLDSAVNRITYATDTATASVRGPLSLARTYIGATSDGTTYGWFAGGAVPSGVSTIDRITYATDTATATARGPLSSVRYRIVGTGTVTDGWFGGGYASPSNRSIINRITYSTDTATASVRGPLNNSTGFMGASTDGTTYGWFAGGGTTPFSSVSRITYANDTATASLRGPLTSSRYGISAAGDSTYGWFGGGRAPAAPGVVTTIDRITYATDTAITSIRGPLNTPTTLSGAASGAQ
jgi:hypothetical protein